MMQDKDIAIVFDCGATNVRVIAINKVGGVVGSHSMPNQTDEDHQCVGGRIWDLEKLWDKLCECSRIVMDGVDPDRIAGVTVTTFGVDGTFVNEHGEMLYPVISWQCERTNAIMANIEAYMPMAELYKTSGVFPYAFNTINKLIWFRENKPEVIDQAHRFLFIPSLLVNKLTGAFMNEATMVGTSMVSDINTRNLSEKLLSHIPLSQDVFGKVEEPGSLAGEVQLLASAQTGIPEGTKTFLAGHDTQFAIFGSGAELNQPVLSSGTWEILMTRSNAFSLTSSEFVKNITTEFDAISGVYNIGQNWLGSGVLEWFAKYFYRDYQGDDRYEKMIRDAELECPGAEGVQVDATFYEDGSSPNLGLIKGLSIGTRRGQIYRAFLESLAFRLREGLEALESAGAFNAERIICVGGGSKNRLWNQLRADICQVPIQLIDQKETTVLGASMFVFAGAGLYDSPEEARKHIPYNAKVVYPSANSRIYEQLYQDYLQLKSVHSKHTTC
ncbi:L-fuculokinase [Persicobacter psychrovividus]|uniref:L-fuculokinase n=1 Tax=Persicobacter psychrovividus TaxID=387638 RepID=A0ABM7VLR2_9BACT|nr:L-fuculokinase [Persicobacter psychrovividus]